MVPPATDLIALYHLGLLGWVLLADGTNAAKFTPSHGHVYLAMHEEQGEAVISVRDTGIGISQDAVGRIFDLLFQADNGLQHTTKGLGIGLTLARELVTHHGGTIHVSSAGEGEGTTFTVRLPLCDAPEHAAVSAMAVAAQPSPERHVLIVDDNEDAANSMALLLKKHGHHRWWPTPEPPGWQKHKPARPMWCCWT